MGSKVPPNSPMFMMGLVSASFVDALVCRFLGPLASPTLTIYSRDPVRKGDNLPHCPVAVIKCTPVTMLFHRMALGWLHASNPPPTSHSACSCAYFAIRGGGAQHRPGADPNGSAG